MLYFFYCNWITVTHLILSVKLFPLIKICKA